MMMMTTMIINSTDMRNSEVKMRLTPFIVTQHLCCKYDKCDTRHFIPS